MRPERWLPLLVAPLLAHAASAAFDANGVKLGDSERVVKEHFPSAHCQPLEWKSRAADRRCDDSRAVVAGLQAQITVYLKADVVEAIDVRFGSEEAESFARLLTEHFGAPSSDKTIEKARTRLWRKSGERARLTVVRGQRRATLLVWRGRFDDEIYKVL